MTSRTTIITGAGGALAGHLIDACLKDGWKLGLVAFSEADVARVADLGAVSVVRADLADEQQARQAIDEAAAALGQVDCLFNIAGGFGMASAVDTTPDTLEGQLSINFRSAFNATRAVLPGMLQRQQGFILGVGAGAVFDGGAQVGAYAASKAALVTWLKSVRHEVAPQGVDVSVIYPMAAIDTPGNRAAMPDADPADWIDPDELASTMLYLAGRSRAGRIFETRVYPRPS